MRGARGREARVDAAMAAAATAAEKRRGGAAREAARARYHRARRGAAAAGCSCCCLLPYCCCCAVPFARADSAAAVLRGVTASARVRGGGCSLRPLVRHLITLLSHRLTQHHDLISALCLLLLMLPPSAQRAPARHRLMRHALSLCRLCRRCGRRCCGRESGAWQAEEAARGRGAAEQRVASRAHIRDGALPRRAHTRLPPGRLPLLPPAGVTAAP